MTEIRLRAPRSRFSTRRVGAVVVYHSGGSYLRDCLVQLPMSMVDEVVVVDNSPTRDARFSVPRGSTAKCVSAGRNLGFGAGVNFGVAHLESGCDAVLVVNPDVRVTESCALRLIRCLDDHRVAVVAPRLISPDGTSQPSARRFPSPLTDLFRRTALGRTRVGRRRLDSYLGPSQCDIATAVDWVVGACMLIRRSAGDQVGWFDDRFFLYFEDVDLCMRLGRHGWRVLFEPDATAEHLHMRDSGGPLRLSSAQRHHLASALRFYLKRWKFESCR